jgi:peptide-methionine (S)-S-oxide reductase
MRAWAAILTLLLAACGAEPPAATHPSAHPDTRSPSAMTSQREKATFGAGCFWGVEHIYRGIPGVIEAYSGYAGGTTERPTYRDICTGTTGHAEVVEVTYDPSKVTYARLAEVFFKMHDPTTLNRQGPDVGTQYRSVIFYHSEAQRQEAERAKAAAQPRFKSPIVTTIEPAPVFWMAEAYHQRYIERTGHPSCHVLVE